MIDLIKKLQEAKQNSSGLFEIDEDTICELMDLLTAEPVAWRYKTTNIKGEPNEGWSFSGEDSPLGLYQPLYTR